MAVQSLICVMVHEIIIDFSENKGLIISNKSNYISDLSLMRMMYSQIYHLFEHNVIFFCSLLIVTHMGCFNLMYMPKKYLCKSDIIR